ncbi:MAG: glycosyltransferase family 2 protein [Mariprofundaceae bacterium]|nr:glycosyltransferase family 2 protein [Mariprofundaceae bacterium]
MVDAIAVIISTYNNPSFLRLVLAAYAKQCDKRFSIYIADDGSNAETRDLIEHMSKGFPVEIHHIWHEDQGFRKARIHNLVLQQVKEAYVILTDGDCIAPPHFIATHRRLAQESTLICGSRILLSPSYTQHLCQSGNIPSFSTFYCIKSRLQGHINRVFPLFLPAHLSAPKQKISGIHGCHISCHTKDLLHINGFDESFEGWGREDSDLVARLLHSGVQRRNLRGAPVLHLWHKENARNHLNDNDALLQACIDDKRKQALIGIGELSNIEDKSCPNL